jgi:hypothetical protein
VASVDSGSCLHMITWAADALGMYGLVDVVNSCMHVHRAI